MKFFLHFRTLVMHFFDLFCGFSCKCLYCVFILIILIGGLGITACSPSGSSNPISASSYCLNTMISITIYDSNDTHLLDECLSICDRYEKIFSRTDAEGELYRLNHGLLTQDSNGYYTVSAQLYDLIKIGKEYSQMSDDAFDIAMEPLTSLWDFSSGESKVPDNAAILEVLPFLNSDDILLQEPNKVAFARDNMGIDLGAIAKGYIADRLKEYLLSQSVNSAVIDLGGNVLCIGQKHDVPFKIGIQKPFADRGKTAAVINISDKSVVSSGIYERYFEKDNTLYHHILDKNTGYPVKTDIVGVTVITDSSVKADALSTTCLSLGLSKGLALIRQTPDADAVFITSDNQLHFSDDFPKEYAVTITP